MVEITTTGILEEIVATTPGLRSIDIAILTKMDKHIVYNGLKRLRANGTIEGVLLENDIPTRGPQGYRWYKKK